MFINNIISIISIIAMGIMQEVMTVCWEMLIKES